MEVNEEGEGKILHLTTQGSRNSLWHIWRTVAGFITLVLDHTHTHTLWFRLDTECSGRSQLGGSQGITPCIYNFPHTQIHTLVYRLLVEQTLSCVCFGERFFFLHLRAYASISICCSSCSCSDAS